MQTIQNTSILQTKFDSENSTNRRKAIHRIPSNHRQAERRLIKHIYSGELRIDLNGRIWRDKIRKGLKSGGSSLYKIKSRRAEHATPAGYLQIRAMQNGVHVYGCAHRLVWQFFNGNIPNGYTINHKNGKKSDNNPTNLEVCTYSENMKHAHKLGLIDQSGEKNPRARLTNLQIVEIRSAYAVGGYTQKQIGNMYKVAFQTISKIVRGDSRKNQLGETRDYIKRRQNNVSRDPISGRFIGNDLG